MPRMTLPRLCVAQSARLVEIRVIAFGARNRRRAAQQRQLVRQRRPRDACDELVRQRRDRLHRPGQLIRQRRAGKQRRRSRPPPRKTRAQRAEVARAAAVERQPWVSSARQFGDASSATA